MKRLLHFMIFVSVRLIYCGIFVISFCHHIGAQEMGIRLYTTKDGLPSAFVIGTYQDKLGYLWVSTIEGSCRFDGKSFTYDGLSDALPDTRSIVVFTDSHLRHWAVTPSGYVEYKGNGIIISYPNTDSLRIRWCFRIIETNEGKIWSLTSAGVYQLDSDKWIKIKFYPGYDDHACRNIIETKDGLYINYGDLLVLRRPDDTYKVIGAFKTPGYYYNDLSVSAGQIYISTLDGIYEIINEQLVKLPGPLGRLKGLYSYYRDSKKRFWVESFPMGLHLVPNGDTTNFISVYKAATGSVINHISGDNQGNIWVTTGNGLLKIYERGFRIFDLPSIIGNAGLRNVLQPPTGPLLINDGSLTQKTFENGVFTKKKLHYKGSTSLPNNELIIDNYAFDDKGRYWYYIRGFALAMQDGNKIYEQTSQLAHLGDEVFDVQFDKYRNKILVAVRTQKFPCQFNDTSFSLLPVANTIEIKGNIMRLHQSANGNILFATDQGAIFSIDKQNICKLQLNEFGRQGRIRLFFNDPSGDVWIIYNGRGLRRYTWQKDSLIFKEQLTKANKLASDYVTSLCFDNENNIWACTNSIVAVFSKKNNTSNSQAYQVVSFFNAEDLQTEGGIDARLTKDNNGNIWYFFNKYLVCFYPHKIKYNRPVPTIAIESIELNLRQTNWAEYADSLSGIFQLPYRLTLAHDNNTIGIYFKGISSSGTDDIKYSYKLEGLADLWSVPSSNDFVSFVKIPPGKYVFNVKAQLPNTNWSEPAVFSFEIKKAFWQTWWFYVLVGIASSAGIYLLFRYRLKQKIELLEMRNRISHDLHDELGSSVSGINLLSQMAVEKLHNNKPDEASEYLFKVKNYTQDVIEKLSDMVWIFNPQNDSIEKLLQRLKSFTVLIALSKNIKIHFVTDKENEITNLTIRHRKAIYFISKEAINNSFKYAECSNIYYTLNANGSKWRLQIQDDGKGFILTGNNNGNGLKNMQARADEIGANFKIQSQPGSGTIVILEF
ncbi:MAG: ATP-binding protein [Chitinophagaceae bacterium]